MASFNLRAFSNSNFHQRVISALLMAPIVLFSVYWGGWLYACVITVIVILGLREWLRLADPLLRRSTYFFALASLLLIMALGAWFSPAFGVMIGTLLVLVLFFLAARDQEARSGWIALGIPYMAGSGLALLYLRGVAGGMGLVFYLLAVVWGTDIGGYIAGRMIGGPKLVPAISPGKTWAGLFGGMALAALCGYGVSAAFGAQRPAVALGLALILSVVSQLGDLFESYAKRRSGVKESGSLIPGHGGILDRIDGLVFAAVFFVFFQTATGTLLQWW